MVVRRDAPRKKPIPLMAFLEPVRMATSLKSADWLSSFTMSLTELLELILVRSLAMPERAWTAMTKMTEVRMAQPGWKRVRPMRARIWSVRPVKRVDLRPRREPIQPPRRLVMIPATS